MKKERIVIAIDGPSGSGKGTVAKMLALSLGFEYLDSGSLYRLAALIVLIGKIKIEDKKEILDNLNSSDFKFEINKDTKEVAVILNGNDVSADIREERCSVMASKLAQKDFIREYFLTFQREYALGLGLIADGRDMGSVIFPNASVKVFLSASLEVRAKRRFEQLKRKQPDVVYGDVLKDMRERDERDSSRKNAPLEKAIDAVKIDNSDMDVTQTFDEIMKIINSK
jgi:cytidylate kinase